MPFDPKDPETAAAIKAAVEEANAGIEAKNRELLDKYTKTKAELRNKSEINPADLERLEAENDKLRDDLSAVQKQAKDATTAAEKAAKALEAEQAITRDNLITKGIQSALIASGVKDEDYLEALTMKFASGADVVAEGDARIARIGDKPVADVIKEWAASDSGKKFVAAPVNGGGGAQGGSGSGVTGKVVSEADAKAMPAKERAAFFASGGAIEQQAA